MLKIDILIIPSSVKSHIFILGEYGVLEVYDIAICVKNTIDLINSLQCGNLPGIMCSYLDDHAYS